jgi:hypothetical protein
VPCPPDIPPATGGNRAFAGRGRMKTRADLLAVIGCVVFIASLYAISRDLDKGYKARSLDQSSDIKNVSGGPPGAWCLDGPPKLTVAKRSMYDYESQALAVSLSNTGCQQAIQTNLTVLAPNFDLSPDTKIISAQVPFGEDTFNTSWIISPKKMGVFEVTSGIDDGRHTTVGITVTNWLGLDFVVDLVVLLFRGIFRPIANSDLVVLSL